MRSHPGIYLVAEQRIGLMSPGPLWLGTQDAVREFFAKLRNDGFELLLTSGNRDLMWAPGHAERIVWLGSEAGKALRISEYL